MADGVHIIQVTASKNGFIHKIKADTEANPGQAGVAALIPEQEERPAGHRST